MNGSTLVNVARCDIIPDSVVATAATAWAAAPPGVTVTGHACDVSDEAQVQRFRDELLVGRVLLRARAGVRVRS